MTDADVLALFDEWNDALQTRDPDLMARLYSNDATLVPTVSARIRSDHEQIADYFTHFMAKKPAGTITESNIQTFGHVATNSGLYTFSFGDGSEIEARFTFVYKKEGERWLIAQHHSSKLPE